MKSVRWAKGAITSLLILAVLPLAGCFYDESPTDPPATSATTNATPATNTVPGGASLALGGAPATEAFTGVDYYFQPLLPTGSSNISFSISGMPAWMTFDATSGLLSGRPNDAQVGISGDIVITATTSEGSGTIGPFTIRVTTPATASAGAGNMAPMISGKPATSVTVGSAYEFQPTTVDKDGGTLIYSLVNGPTWATFSTTTGRLGGTPRAGSEGTYADVLIRVSDGYTTVALPAFTIRVQASTATAANVAPVITGTPAATAVNGVQYSFVPAATDSNSDKLNFSVQNLPAWAHFNTATGEITGVPITANLGSYDNIVVSVSDGRATTTLPAFKIDVMATLGNATAVMTWNPPLENADGSPLTDLSGYVIHYGKDAGNLIYSQRIANGTQVSFQATGLDSGLWNFSIRSVNSAGAESDPILVAMNM